MEVVDLETRIKPQIGIQTDRIVNFDIRTLRVNERRVTVSFSSEKPVERSYGLEILQHDPGSINLNRLNSIGVVLFNHDKNRVIGRIENARLSVGEYRTYADVVFDQDKDSDAIFSKVQSGTLKGVSVGYDVDDWEEVWDGKMSRNGRFKGPAFVAAKWTPFEISIVSVPADDSVGVGRDMAGRSRTGAIDVYERQLIINKNFINML